MSDQSPDKPDTMEQSFLTSIVASPADNAPRLIFADWLEDNGGDDGSEYAAFIRGQIAGGRGLEVPRMVVEWWVANLSEYDFMPRSESSRVYLEACKFGLGTIEMVMTVRFDRGFPCWVRCREETWLQYGKVIAKWQPLTRVRLVDKTPLPLTSNNRGVIKKTWTWYGTHADLGQSPASLHPGMYEFLLPAKRGYLGQSHEFDTEAVALTALSDACLLWARQR